MATWNFRLNRISRLLIQRSETLRNSTLWNLICLRFWFRATPRRITYCAGLHFVPRTDSLRPLEKKLQQNRVMRFGTIALYSELCLYVDAYPERTVEKFLREILKKTIVSGTLQLEQFGFGKERCQIILQHLVEFPDCSNGRNKLTVS